MHDRDTRPPTHTSCMRSHNNNNTIPRPSRQHKTASPHLPPPLPSHPPWSYTRLEHGETSGDTPRHRTYRQTQAKASARHDRPPLPTLPYPTLVKSSHLPNENPRHAATPRTNEPRGMHEDAAWDACQLRQCIVTDTTPCLPSDDKGTGTTRGRGRGAGRGREGGRGRQTMEDMLSGFLL